MSEISTLESIMTALRLLAIVLSLAIISFWGPSLARVLTGRERERDSVRAIWVPLAVAVLLFQARWLYPGLTDVVRLRLWVAAQSGMVITLLAAIYYHGASDERFHRRRTMMAHTALLLTCIVASLWAPFR